MHTPLALWGGFFALVVVLLTFDLGLLHRKERDIGIRESLWLSVGYMSVALGFAAFVYSAVSPQAGKDFLTGYLIEKSLSLDNLFVIALVFGQFHIPRRYQYRVLFWGVLGVVLLRGLMIGLGAALIHHFHFILYFFGAFLILTGARMLFVSPDAASNLESSRLLRWLRHRLKVTRNLHGNQFFANEAGEARGLFRRRATPLLLVLVFIELADIAFAVDSVPAVFAVTTDPFVVYTSNIFAILGLRALYFALAAMLNRFVYLKYALALVLLFIGAKIFLSTLWPIPSGTALGVTIALLSIGILASLWHRSNTTSGHPKNP